MKLLRPLQFLAITSLLLALGACAGFSQSRTMHSFAFDPYLESENIDLLYYRYGSANEVGLRTSQHALNQIGKSPGISITGNLPVGDDLYVKWQDKRTGQIYEDSVDLKSRLPFIMYKQEIHPVIEGSQLYVYLVSYEPAREVMRSEDVEQIRQMNRTRRERVFNYRLRNRVIQIYPERIVDPHLPPDFKK